MATIRVPSNVSSITFSTSGVKAPAAGLITGLTAAEGTAFSQQGIKGGNKLGPAKLMRTALNGDVNISVPALITSITINAIVYAVGGAVTSYGKELTDPVPAPAASQFLYENFGLVTG